RQILPAIKPLFPDGDFGKDLGTYSLIAVVFGLALLAFLIAASKLHKRPAKSFLTTHEKFSWKSYFYGFSLWGLLLLLSSLLLDFERFRAFLESFNFFHFWVLLLVGFVSIGIQSFFEELVIRGYFLQGLYLRIKNIPWLITVNALIFGVLHFGYGLHNFLYSWLFGVAFAMIVIFQNRIEFVSGAHNANNLLLALVFLDLSEATNEGFSWSINWTEFIVDTVGLLLLVGLAYMFSKRKPAKAKLDYPGKSAIALLAITFLCSAEAFSQPTQLSDHWIDDNVHILNNDSTHAGKFDFLKDEISERRIVFLGEATHFDGSTFERRSEIVKYLVEEMDFEVVLFEAGMFDLMVANGEFQKTHDAQKIRSALWNFWKTAQWNDFYSFIEKHKQGGHSLQFAGFDCKFSSSYGFDNHNYSKFLEQIFKDKFPEVLSNEAYREYIAIWQDIENGYQQSGIKGGLSRIRFKMTEEEKIKFRQLSQWIAGQLVEIKEHTVAQMVKSNDEGILAYSDLRLLKMIFNKKSIIPINNRRDELMAENIIHLLKNVYPDKKIIVIGGSYHFIRNNNLIEPLKIQGIPIPEATIMGDLIYDDFIDEIYTIGFTAFEGEYGLVKPNKKGTSVKSPSQNSLEFQLASKGIAQGFVPLARAENEPFFSEGTSLRLFDHQSAATSKNWSSIIDAVVFIKTVSPAQEIANP
ncbi:MAG: erythromycin esterase family protein, partial [Flavobacteriales bacterium]|nr:erythromycin esterase family protein [Flavobacteriales bacterium]